jgi:hypothetical protein
MIGRSSLSSQKVIDPFVLSIHGGGQSGVSARTGRSGVSRSTAHRRFTRWTEAGLWKRLHQQFLHRRRVVSEID